MKLEMLIGHMLPLSYYRKILQNLFHLNWGPQTCQIWILLKTECGNYCKRRCTKYTSLIWTNWNSDWERSGPSWIMLSLHQLFVSDIVDSSRSLMRVGTVLHRLLQYLPTCCYQLDWNLVNLEATV